MTDPAPGIAEPPAATFAGLRAAPWRDAGRGVWTAG
jgi:hypothetical protein